MRRLLFLSFLALALAGCSSQDFGRPVARIGDMVDSGHAYVEVDDEEVARLRAERLAKALLVWEEQQDKTVRDYNVGPDDVLAISVFSLEKPGEQAVLSRAVSKSGAITLPLVGDLEVGGHTVRDVEKRVIAAYEGKYLKNPQVTVAVSKYQSAPVVVTGMVGKPGVYYLQQSQSTVLELLSEAGGLRPEAGERLQIIRNTEPGSSSLSSNVAALPGVSSEVARPVVPTGTLTDTVSVHEAYAPVATADTATVTVDDPAVSTNGASITPEPPRKRSFLARLFRRRHAAPSESAAAEAQVSNAVPAQIETEAPATNAVEVVAAAEPEPPTPPPAAEAGAAADAAGEATIRPEVVTVDLSQLLDNGDVRLNLPVRGGDIISVPPGKKRYFYVLGYVNAPGAFELRQEQDIASLQAVALAGGLSGAARAQNSLLIREGADGRQVTQLDLTKIARGTRPDVLMRPGDTLIVGSGFLAKIGEFLRPTVGASASLTPVP